MRDGCWRDPAAIHAMCEDYRAAASIDLVHDGADLDRKIECPVLAFMSNAWSDRKRVASDPLEIWRRYARDVRVINTSCGHFIPEEAPQDVVDPMREFLRAA